MAITDSAYRGEDQDHLAVRSGLIVLISARGPVVGNNPIQILEYISKKQSRVCRSTFTAELYSALDMVGLGLDHQWCAISSTHGRQARVRQDHRRPRCGHRCRCRLPGFGSQRSEDAHGRHHVDPRLEVRGVVEDRPSQKPDVDRH